MLHDDAPRVAAVLHDDAPRVAAVLHDDAPRIAAVLHVDAPRIAAVIVSRSLRSRRAYGLRSLRAPCLRAHCAHVGASVLGWGSGACSPRLRLPLLARSPPPCVFCLLRALVSVAPFGRGARYSRVLALGSPPVRSLAAGSPAPRRLWLLLRRPARRGSRLPSVGTAVPPTAASFLSRTAASFRASVFRFPVADPLALTLTCSVVPTGAPRFNRLLHDCRLLPRALGRRTAPLFALAAALLWARSAHSAARARRRAFLSFRAGWGLARPAVTGAARNYFFVPAGRRSFLAPSVVGTPVGLATLGRAVAASPLLSLAGFARFPIPTPSSQ